MHTDQVLEAADTMRGFEVAKGSYVTVTDQDLSGLAVESLHTIGLSQFVQAAEIDPVYFEKEYWIEPEAIGARPYALLYQALQQRQLLELVLPERPLRPREEFWMRAYAGRLFNAMPDNRHGPESRAAMSRSQIVAWERRYEEGRDSLSLETRREIARTTRIWARQLVVRAHKRLSAIKTNVAANFRTASALEKNATALRGVPKSPAHRAAMRATHPSAVCRCHPRKETQ